MAETNSDEAFLAVVDQIYLSVERPEFWPETLQSIANFLGGPRDFWSLQQPLFSPSENMSERTREAASAGCHGTFLLSRADLRLLDQYTEEFGELLIRFLKNVFLSMLWSQKDVGARDLIGLRMTRFYLGNFDAAGLMSSSKTQVRQMIASLWESGRMFQNNHLQSIRRLLPHLERALRLQMRFSATDLQANTVSGVLDQLTLGVILINGAGQPAWQNRRAREIIAHSNAIRLSETGFTGPTTSHTHALRALIRGAISGDRQDVLAIPRGDSLRPLLLTAISLKFGMPQSDQFPSAAIFISDPDHVDNPTIASLRRAFDLTYREAEMAIAIGHGHGLKAAAVRMGVAVTTARSQLQQAFAKTGTKHQAELAALVRTLTQIRQD
jgi:DNA-binding CsgD family transcriptional regulator